MELPYLHHSDLLSLPHWLHLGGHLLRLLVPNLLLLPQLLSPLRPLRFLNLLHQPQLQNLLHRLRLLKLPREQRRHTTWALHLRRREDRSPSLCQNANHSAIRRLSVRKTPTLRGSVRKLSRGCSITGLIVEARRSRPLRWMLK